MGKELYPWQEQCIRRWFANGGRGIVQAATGSGKTLLALAAASRLEQKLGRRLLVRIVVPGSALMRQWYRELSSFLSESGRKVPAEIRRQIGLKGGGYDMALGHKYMIYVVNSARYTLARRLLEELRDGEAVLLIADECHRYGSGQNRLIFEFLPHLGDCEGHFFSLGLTATLPSGTAQSYLTSALGRRIYSHGIAQAAALNNVCRYDIFHISLPFLPAEQMEYEELTDRMNFLYNQLIQARPFLRSMGRTERFEAMRALAGDKDRKTAEAASRYLRLSYKRKGLVCLACARLTCACDLIERLPKGEKILVFGERIRQAEELYAILRRQYPGRVGRCHSRMSPQANKNTLNRFRDGELRILIACRSLDEGVDIPDASSAVILSGTSVQRQRIQRLGRVIRPKEGKDRAFLYYLHVTGSSEDDCFLPEMDGCRVLDLEYLPDERAFANPPYEAAAAAFLEDMRHKGADEEKIAEIVRCLRLGIVRSDWLDEPGAVREKLCRARSVRDRNYWICMQQLGRYSSHPAGE